MTRTKPDRSAWRSIRPNGPYSEGGFPTQRREKTWLYGVFAAVFLVMLALTWLTPMVADDYSYSFSWADNSRIRSLGQIVSSMAVHRQLTNGRVLTHGLVHLLLIGPKFIFDLANAGMAVLLLHLFQRQLGPLSAGKRALLLGCGALLLWDLTPVFGQVFLWLDGAVNYGWGVCLFLLFLRPYAAAWLGEERGRSAGKTVLFLLLAFAAGTWSESGAPASFFVALCLLLLSARRSGRLDWLLLAGLILELAGFAFLMSAPATFGRASTGFDLSTLANNLQHVLLPTREHMLPLYVLYAVSFALAASLGADRRRLTLSGLYALGGLVCLAAYFFAAYFTYRHFCFAVCFTVLAELLLLAELIRGGRPVFARVLTAGLAAWFLFLFPLGVLDIGVTYQHSREREAAIRQALAAGETEVTLQVYVPATPYSAPYQLEDLYPQAHVWPNISLEAYYGLEAVYGVLPEGADSP